MKVYVAGVFETRDMLRLEWDALPRDLREGVQLVSTWLHEDSTDVTEWVDRVALNSCEAADNRLLAERDLEQIQQADGMILDTRALSLRGGREVELGVALQLGRPVVLVGPARNIFHTLAVAQCRSLAEALRALRMVLYEAKSNITPRDVSAGRSA